MLSDPVYYYYLCVNFEHIKENNRRVSELFEWEGCLVGREGQLSPRASLIETFVELLNSSESERRRKPYKRLELRFTEKVSNENRS